RAGGGPVQFRVRAVLLGRSEPQPTPGRGAADPRGRPRVGVSSPGATLRRGAGPAPLRTIALGTTHALPLHARPRLATARLAGVRSPRRPDSRGIPRPRCRDDARRVQRGGMGRRVRPGGIRRDRPRVRLGSAPPRRGRHVRFVRLDRGPAALARGGWQGVRGQLARLPARRHRRRRGPDLRRVLRRLQIDQRRPGALRPQRRHLGGARAPHLLPQPRLGRRGAARASQARATPRFRRLRGVPRVPRGVARGPGAESELVRSRRPVADARYHLERVRFARGDRTGAAVWAARGDRVRAVEQRRTRQRRRDRPGPGRATPPSGPRRLVRPDAPAGPELPFLAADAKGEDVYFRGAEAHLARRVLVTGYHGDQMWSKRPRAPSADIVRGDQSGLSLSEYRLWAGFIHLPVPFIGVRQIGDVRALSRSAAMAPWDV